MLLAHQSPVLYQDDCCAALALVFRRALFYFPIIPKYKSSDTGKEDMTKPSHSVLLLEEVEVCNFTHTHTKDTNSNKCQDF